MIRRSQAAFLALALVAGLPAGEALAQDPGAPISEGGAATISGHVRIKAKEGGWKIDDLFKAINDATGKSILYDAKTQPIQSSKVEFVGDALVPEDKLFEWLQAVLAYHNLVLVPVGPKNSRGDQQWFCMDSAKPALQSRPVYVDEQDLDDYADRDGLYIVTSIKLKHISDTSRVRSALSQLSTRTAAVGKVVDIQGSRSLIVAEFAPMAAAIKKLISYIDVAEPSFTPQMEVVYLEYAVASELEPIISELIQQSSTPGSRNQPRNPRQASVDPEEPEPKLIADDRLDAIILYATEGYRTQIKELITQLDVPTRTATRLNFIPLRHTNAEDIRDILEELITGVSSAAEQSGSGTGRSGGRRPGGSQPGNQGTGASLVAGLSENEPVIVADPNSNSLIIHASPTQFESLRNLVKELDQSRPQVLIETALVQLTGQDSLRIGVDIFEGSDEIALDTNNDGTMDAITRTARGVGVSSFDGFGDLVNETINGIDVPISGTGAFGVGNGLRAGIYDDGRLAGVISALQVASKAKIVTMPSVVTNDNQEATLEFTSETSFRESVRTDSGTDRDSFQTVQATTTLTISPHISSDNYLRLEIDQSVENFGERPGEGAPPNKFERRIQTSVTLPDKATVVLGGLIQENETTTVNKVPFLGDIPLIGFFFRFSEDTSTPEHMFLFVTPHILRDTERFVDYTNLTWEKKLVLDDLFGEEVELIDTNFRGKRDAVDSADKIRLLEESGELDGGRLKAPPSTEEREARAKDAFRKETGTEEDLETQAEPTIEEVTPGDADEPPTEPPTEPPAETPADEPTEESR